MSGEFERMADRMVNAREKSEGLKNSLTDQADKLEPLIQRISDGHVTTQNLEELRSGINTLADTAQDHLEARLASGYTMLDILYDGSQTGDEEKKRELMSKITSATDETSRHIETLQGDINAIFERAANERRNLLDSEIEEIITKTRQLERLANPEKYDVHGTTDYILYNLKHAQYSIDDLDKWDSEDNVYKQFEKSFTEGRDKSLEAIANTRDAMIADAQAMYDGGLFSQADLDSVRKRTYEWETAQEHYANLKMHIGKSYISAGLGTAVGRVLNEERDTYLTDIFSKFVDFKTEADKKGMSIPDWIRKYRSSYGAVDNVDTAFAVLTDKFTWSGGGDFADVIEQIARQRSELAKHAESLGLDIPVGFSTDFETNAENIDNAIKEIWDVAKQSIMDGSATPEQAIKNAYTRIQELFTQGLDEETQNAIEEIKEKLGIITDEIISEEGIINVRAAASKFGKTIPMYIKTGLMDDSGRVSEEIRRVIGDAEEELGDSLGNLIRRARDPEDSLELEDIMRAIGGDKYKEATGEIAELLKLIEEMYEENIAVVRPLYLILM